MNIVLTTYNRYEYLDRSLSSLLKSEFDNDTLWIFDDHSDVEPRTPLLLESLGSMTDLKINLNLSQIHLGCDNKVFNSTISVLEKTDDQFVFILDSDGIYNPKWVALVKNKLQNFKKNVAALSIYDSINHKPVKDYDEDLVEKASLGGFALAVNREVFEKIDPNIILPGHDNFSWDWQFTKISREMDYKLLCTKISYAQHIGVVGAHSNPFTYDRSETFTGEQNK